MPIMAPQTFPSWAGFTPNIEDVKLRNFLNRLKMGRESLAMISDKLVAGIAAVAVLLLVSAALGLGIAGVLRLWHKYKPVKEADVHDDKHPLGLDR